jgi:hypothetical protein
MRAAHTATVYQGPLVVDDELWALLSTLAKDAALRVKRFPREAPLPSAIRGLDIYTTVDARDESPPQGRWPVAFLYRGFWWTFWLKHAPAPPDPDSGGTPSGSDAFDTLIVFPEYAERQDQ